MMNVNLLRYSFKIRQKIKFFKPVFLNTIQITTDFFSNFLTV